MYLYPTTRDHTSIPLPTHTRTYDSVSCCISRRAIYGNCPTIDLPCVSEATRATARAGLPHGMAVLDVRGTMAREAADEMFPQDMRICVFTVRATDLVSIGRRAPTLSEL
jgi:hypothetical protein